MIALLKNKRGVARGTEELFWLIAISFSFDAFLYINNSANGFATAGQDRPWIGALLLSTYLVAVVGVAMRRGLRMPRLDLNDCLLVGLPILCLASSLWSVAPFETLKKSVLYATYTGFLVSAYWRLGFSGSYQRIWITLVALAALGILGTAVFPEFAVSHDNHEGAWKGVFAHKNMFGAACSFGLVVQSVLMKFGYLKSRPIRLAGGLVLALGLVGSRSTTAILALLAAIISGRAWILLSGRALLKYRNFTTVFLTATLIFIQSYVSLADVANFFGKDASATGRIPLWVNALSEASRRPLLGYGYGAYWIGEEHRYGRIERTIGFEVTHSHNGYLEMALAFGFVASFLIVALIGVRFIRYFKCDRVSAAQSGAVFSVLIFLVIYNISESALIIPAGGIWMSFLLICMLASRAIRPGAQYNG